MEYSRVASIVGIIFLIICTFISNAEIAPQEVVNTNPSVVMFKYIC